MSPIALLFVYCIFIFTAATAGGRLSEIIRMTHLRTQLLMSAVGGLMIGVALLHLLPHAVELLQSASSAGLGALFGLLSMFLLIRLFHTHDHGVLDSDNEATEHDRHCSHCSHHPDEHDHTHGHDSAGDDKLDQSSPKHGHNHSRRLGWGGVFFGLSLHTLIDGVALSSSVIADTKHGAWMDLAGIGTFLVIVLHIPLDSFAITSVMSRQGWSVSAQRLANFLFSIACPLGAFLMYAGVTTIISDERVLGWGLAVSAGFFICIALADLLPEVAFHDHDRAKLTMALLLGVSIALIIENLPGHRHDHKHSHDELSPHSHSGAPPSTPDLNAIEPLSHSMPTILDHHSGSPKASTNGGSLTFSKA